MTVSVPGDYGKPRPALVIQSDFYDETRSTTVLPLTGTLSDTPLVRHTVAPSPANGLQATWQVQIDSPISVARAKVGPTIGRLDDEAMLTITRNLAVFLGIA